MKTRTVHLGRGRKARVVYRLLVWPSVHTTYSKDQAERSKWAYRPDRDEEGRRYYRITPLAVLHRLTGLTLHFDDEFRFPVRARIPKR